MINFQFTPFFLGGGTGVVPVGLGTVVVVLVVDVDGGTADRPGVVGVAATVVVVDTVVFIGAEVGVAGETGVALIID